MGPPFSDRQVAGQELAERLAHLAGRDDTVVLGLPRGGLPVAAEVASALNAPLDIVLVRKVGTPHNPELAMGAIAGPGGRTEVLNAELASASGLDAAKFEALAAPERAELARREKIWGTRLKPGALAGKVVILVDDGIATGATMRAAIAAVRADKPARVVVASPVAAGDTLGQLSRLADETVCLAAPELFIAVGRHYLSFPQVSDDAVRSILESAKSLGDPASDKP